MTRDQEVQTTPLMIYFIWYINMVVTANGILEVSLKSERAKIKHRPHRERALNKSLVGCVGLWSYIVVLKFENPPALNGNIYNS